MTRILLSLILGVALMGASLARAQQAATPGPDYETRLSALEDQMRSMNGQIEQLNYGLRRIDQTLTRVQEDYEARLAKLETAAAQVPAPQPSAPAPQAAAPTAAPAAPTAPVKGTLGELKLQGGQVTGGTVNPQAPPLPETPPDYGLTPQEQYDRAFNLLRQANYEEAEKAFRDFIDKNPKDRLIDNAKYWYAETLYVRGQFADAAVAFADAYQQNTRGTKAPDSLLKLAMALDATGKTQDACTALGELKAGYPNAPASLRMRAGEERTKLKCSSAAP